MDDEGKRRRGKRTGKSRQLAFFAMREGVSRLRKHWHQGDAYTTKFGNEWRPRRSAARDEE